MPIPVDTGMEVFPAPAGINRYEGDSGSTISRVPRASGDKPNPSDSGPDTKECSPRQRG